MELNYRRHDEDRDSEGNSHDYEMNDLEKPITDVKTTNVESNEFDYYEDDSVQATVEDTKLGFISRWAHKLNAETKGVEPITDEEKTEDSVIDAASMWFSANMVIASYALGALGPIVFGLNFAQSVLVIVFFNMMGLVSVAFFSVFGAEFGLRQMILSRFLLGNVTARVFTVINIVACVGWGVVNTVVSAQLLHMVNRGSHELPLWGGCLVIVGGTVLVTFFGYNIIHAYERWSWMPNFAVFLVIIARLHKSGQFSNGPWEGGATTAGGVLSFGSAIYGFAAGYTTFAADYTVYMPRTVNKYKIFFSLCAGLSFPLFFTMILGAASAMGAVNNPEWMALYKSDNMGGLTYAILVPNSLHGFGEFCCVVLALSTVANNIPNMYTIALSVQALWEPLSRVPRVVWTLCGNAAVVGICIPAAYYFEGFMQNFMDSIGYYLAIYVAIAVSEHFFYRKGFKGYNIEDWNNPKKLPIGIAGCAALVVGAFGVALGMSQTYWTGEMARHIGKYGGDIGFEMGMSWAFVIFNIVRPFEIKYFGR